MPQPVLREPHGDGREPRIERAGVVVVMQMRVGANEGVLSDLFRAGGLADHHQDQTEQPVLVSRHQMPEGITIAPTDVANDVAVRDTHASAWSASSTRPNPIEA